MMHKLIAIIAIATLSACIGTLNVGLTSDPNQTADTTTETVVKNTRIPDDKQPITQPLPPPDIDFTEGVPKPIDPQWGVMNANDLHSISFEFGKYNGYNGEDKRDTPTWNNLKHPQHRSKCGIQHICSIVYHPQPYQIARFDPNQDHTAFYGGELAMFRVNRPTRTSTRPFAIRVDFGKRTITGKTHYEESDEVHLTINGSFDDNGIARGSANNAMDWAVNSNPENYGSFVAILGHNRIIGRFAGTPNITTGKSTYSGGFDATRIPTPEHP